MTRQGSAERSPIADPPSHPIIFFDGVCALCNHFVDVVLRADTRGTFRFAPLQGTTAQRLLPLPPDDPQAWSLLYLDEQGLHEQSDASLAVCRRLGGPWRLLALARLVPRPVRDAAYRLIVRNRYRWFGRHPTCRIPNPEERQRFLP
jgi:predicted DCC family thiol-disulfide oxidoreductase YuxK